MEYFAARLIDWYRRNYRQLPWRETKDPYKIWLSEIILQQTRVQQGQPYYQRFIEKYPKIDDLAAAPEDEVLKLWEGLGYYSRARNLLQCARQVIDEFGGQFPGTYEKLLTLKGIGPYSAAAIASFAFGKAVPVVDGNVLRVISRYFCMEKDISSSKVRKEIFDLSSRLISTKYPDLYNQAIMELGALVCTPRNPACTRCPLQDNCEALATNKTGVLPFKKSKTKVRKRYFNYLVIEETEGYFMKRREGKDIWQGLYDFPMIEDKQRLIAPEEVKERLDFPVDLVQTSLAYRHILSHQIIWAKFFHIRPKIENFASSLNENGRHYDLAEIDQLALPVLILKYVHEYLF